LPADVKAAQSTIGQQGLDLVGQTKMRMCQGQVMPKQHCQRAKLKKRGHKKTKSTNGSLFIYSNREATVITLNLLRICYQ
jgi:hypothetical protein